MKGSAGAKIIRPWWLLSAILTGVIEIILLLLKNHDAILIIGLHLNFKMGFIADIEQRCEAKGTPNQILRNLDPPEFPWTDDCDRSQLGEKVILPGSGSLPSFAQLELNDTTNTNLQLGGVYPGPSDCTPYYLNKAAIIIPHRHREYHLKQLLSVLHPTLQRQKIQYTVFVLHQAGEGTFNKARLLNAGVKEALKVDPTFNCFIMHDVDLVMEFDSNLYYCNPNVARHISAGIDKYNYELPYDGLFGGVVALTKDQFERINGYSNQYWGWGCEDDDMFIRVVHSCVGLEHVLHENGHYKMIYHPQDDRNSINSNRFWKLIHAADRQFIDGYNNVESKYKVVNVDKSSKMYTNVTIDVGSPLEDVKVSEEKQTVEEADPDFYEVSIHLIVIMALLIIISVYKSHVVHILIRRNSRQRHGGYQELSTDSDESPLCEEGYKPKSKKSRQTQHQRSQSLGVFQPGTLRIGKAH